MNDSYFYKSLLESGVTLSTNDYDEFHEINCDKAIFIKNLTKILRFDIQYPQNVNDFLQDLFDFIDTDDSHLDKYLLPMKTTSTDASRSRLQCSLIRLMLCVECIQTKLITWLLQKIAIISLSNEKGKNRPRLILSQLCWLDIIVDCETLVANIIEILHVTPFSVKIEIILCIPEIVDDSQHSKVAIELKKLLNRDKSLTNAILDTLTNLSLSPDVLKDLQTSLLQSVSSVEMKDLPILIKFILENISSENNIFDIVSTLRNELDLTPSANCSSSQQLLDQKSIEMLTLDTIRICMTVNHIVGDAWLKALENVRSALGHKSIDFLIIILMHAFPKRKKNVDSLIKSKIRNGFVTEELIVKTFRLHAFILGSYIETFFALSEMLLCSNEACLNFFALVLYREAFANFSSYCQHEIVTDLVTKITSGEKFREKALKVLCHIATEYTSAMKPFALYLSNLLDNIDGMNLGEIRQILNLLSRLAYFNCNEASVIRDDLHIVIRKQLSSNKLHVKRMGVIGAVMTAKNMSTHFERNNSVVESSHASQDTSVSTVRHINNLPLKQAKKLLEFVKYSTKSVPEAAGLFMDELSEVVRSGNIDYKLQKWISDTMANDFQNEYIAGVNDPIPSGVTNFIPLTLKFNLEDENTFISTTTGGAGSSSNKADEDDPIVLKMVPMLLQSMTAASVHKNRRNEFSEVCCLMPHFRLLRNCIFYSQKGDITDIDALLGCPLWYPESHIITKIGSLTLKERCAICSSLFYVLNWFRELLNAFNAIENDDDKKKVLCRLKQIILVQNDVKLCLKHTPTFLPPSTLPMADVSGWQPPSIATKRPASSSKKPLGKSKRTKLQKENVNASALTQLSTLGTQQPTMPPPPPATVNNEPSDFFFDLAVDYSPFLRELDMDVFNILSFGLISIGSTPPEEIEYKDPQIRPPELLFLLTDLSHKLGHAFVNTNVHKIGFGIGSVSRLKNVGFANLDRLNPSYVAVRVSGLLDYIFADLETIAAYFKRFIDINDGVFDVPGVFTPDYNCLISCFEVGFKVLQTFFSWNGFKSSAQRSLLKRSLASVGSRGDSSISPHNSLKELVVSAFNHVDKFSVTVTSLASANGLLQLLDAIICSHGDESFVDLKQRISRHADDYLRRTWYSPVKVGRTGTALIGCVNSLIKVRFTNASDVLNAVSEYVFQGLRCYLDTKLDNPSPISTFTKQTFALYFRSLLYYLTEAIRQMFAASCNQHSDLQQLQFWTQASELLHSFVSVVKTVVTNLRVLVAPILKYSRIFVDLFHRHGMPLLDRLFSQCRVECIALLKSIQQSTRLLQHICSYSKLNRFVALSKHVPFLKKSLESLLYRVKGALALNDCLDAFWMGNLKNRNLCGDEIKSQTTVDDKEEEDDECALPEEGMSDVELEQSLESNSDNERFNCNELSYEV